jgi:hypothetical protein
MSVYMFGGGKGHLPERADGIAMEHGASLVNHVDPGCSCGHGCRPGKCPRSRRHWFTGPNRGEPFDRDMARAVEADLVEAGLIDAATGARA